MEREVTLPEMLLARETRVCRQQALLQQYGLPLISFSLNIAGPIKNSPLLRRVFREGLTRLQNALQISRIQIEHREETDTFTGCEALFVVRGIGDAVKEVCIELEDEDRLGRLFDLDVIKPNGIKLNRESKGHPARPCMVCGKPGKGCASRRIHSLDELRRAMLGAAQNFFAEKDAHSISGQAVRALLYEVCTTPKPGLVDRANNGSHQDMNLFTFLDSTSALLPYFQKAVSIGQETAALPPEETFRRLRRVGIQAEQAMFDATNGVNTHKGAIFSLGIVCAAAGRLWMPELPWASPDSILSECAAMSREAMEADFDSIRARSNRSNLTSGEQFFLQYGLRGIRGELADGLPGVRDIGLPALRDSLAHGATLEQAGCSALLQMISQSTDTNLISRGGPEGWAAQACIDASNQTQIPTKETLSELDLAFIQRNLSPGGCADLLSITYFLHFCAEKRIQFRKTHT